MVLTLTIDGRGAVAHASSAGGSAESHGFTECLVERAKSWTFPPPDGGGSIVVAYPFSFASGRVSHGE